MVTFKPSVRDSFSDRNGLNVINKTIQKDDLDERTRNEIINFVDLLIKDSSRRCLQDEMFDFIYKRIFYVTDDEIPSHFYEKRQYVIDGIKWKWEYHEIFSFLEEFFRWCKEKLHIDEIYNIANSIFERECVGYRFVDGLIVDVIDEQEIKEIEDALNCKYSACKKSITKALDLLYNRENPDYDNSVKESISAIESMCNIILETNNATLGEALNKLEKQGFKIHGALKNAFSSLYGYTSNKSGIRHNNGLDENVSFEEAKFMLVTCSTFLNYLIEIYEKK